MSSFALNHTMLQNISYILLEPCIILFCCSVFAFVNIEFTNSLEDECCLLERKNGCFCPCTLTEPFLLMCRKINDTWSDLNLFFFQSYIYINMICPFFSDFLYLFYLHSCLLVFPFIAGSIVRFFGYGGTPLCNVSPHWILFNGTWIQQADTSCYLFGK